MHVAKKIKSTGPINIQLRLNKNGDPLIFEINPRFSGSAPMRAIAGFNEPDMILRNFVYNENLSRNHINYSLEFYRVFQEYYIDNSISKGRAEFMDYI